MRNWLVAIFGLALLIGGLAIAGTARNVVLGERVVGSWDGGIDHFAVSASLLRQGEAGPILAARYL